MNVDSSYMQYINSLMNEDGFELPGGRRFSIGSYSSDVEVALDVEECKYPCLICLHCVLEFNGIHMMQLFLAKKIVPLAGETPGLRKSSVLSADSGPSQRCLPTQTSSPNLTC